MNHLLPTGTDLVAARKLPAARFLQAVNPLVKMAASLGFTLFAFALSQPRSLAVLAVAVLALTLGTVRISPKIWALAISLEVIFSLLAGWAANDWSVALFNALRLTAIVLLSPILIATTRPSDLIRSFQAIRLPAFLTLGLILIWRFFPLIYQEAQRILEANQLRGIDLSRQPQHWFSGLFVPLIFRIVTYADEVAIGLETRGYDPEAPRSLSQVPRWTHADTLFTAVSLGLVTLVLALELPARGYGT